jgi:hypothetical protein
MSLSAEYDWQKERRIDPRRANRCPVQGFGPAAKHTLWLLSPIVGRRTRFVGGKPKIEVIGDATQDPELNRLRDLVMMRTLPADPKSDLLKCVVSVDLSIFEYAAYLIAMDYRVTDDDLEFLLPAERNAKWINSVLVHAAGGKDAIVALARIDPESLSAMLTMQRADQDPVANAVNDAVAEINNGGIIGGQQT